MATILIVEDDDANLRLAVFVVTSARHQVITATTAEAGILLAHAQQPALILLDMRLPGIDGFEAVARLKADASTCQIPVIALTALAMTGDEERILAAGCDGYIAKPISYRALLTAVGAWLPDRRVTA